MSTAARLVKLVEGLDADGVLSATKGGTGNTTGGGTSSPTVSQIAYSGDDTAANPSGGQTITLTGTNFAQGAKVLINTTEVGVVTVVSATQITFTAPQLAAGSYILYVVNTNGSTAIAVPGIQYSGTPAWTTAAGTLGTVYETAPVSATVAATSDSAVSYSLASGTLPTGATLASNGTISGTSVLTASSTTYSFTIKATDAENQDTDRSFSLTINPDVVSWSSPASGATLTGTPGAAYSSALVATSAAGQTVSYSADALPAGLAISGATITGTPTTAGTSSTTLTATAATTNRTAQVTVSWTITVAADTYFPLTTLLLNSETVATPFAADASTNNFAVTAVGNAKPSNFNPYTPGYYSNYFDGSGDSLTAPASTAWNFTGDWTFECWINPNSITGFQTFLGQWGDTSSVFIWKMNSSGRMYLENLSTAITATSTTIVANQWQHIALTRSSNTIRMFVNGVLDATTATRSGTYYSSGLMRVGASGVNEPFAGYISNMRVINGTALYTTNFTPPTGPLTAVAGTSLLTCQSNRFLDTSTNNFTITKVGDVKVSGFDPFVTNANYATYGSTYLNGTTDYLTVPQNAAFSFGTGDFTVEGWWNFNNISISQGLISLGTGANGGGPYNGWWFDYESSGILRFYRYAGGSEIYSSFSVTLVTNTWYHIACTRSGTAVKMFVNGVQVGTTATSSTSFDNVNSDPLVIGRFITGQGTFYLDGYVSDVRITKGTALYTANFTPPTAPLTSVAGTSLLTCQTNQPLNNQTFLDNSSSALNITRTGNATQGTFSPYGANWSASLNGTTDFVYTPYNAAFDFGTGDFTMECWFNYTGASFVGTHIMGLAVGSSSTRSYYFYTDASGFLNFSIYANGSTATLLTATTAFTRNVWNHAALVRSSGTTKIYLNGVVVATAANQNIQPYLNASSFFTIGREAGFNGAYFPGYISNVRVVKGTAVYTSAFTPPTQPLTAIANTSLLTCQSPNFTDNSLNSFAITPGGTASTQKFSPFAVVTQTPNTHSVYFGTKTDYVSIPATTALTTYTGDFTFECWVNPTATNLTSSWSIWDSRQSGGTPNAMVFSLVALASPVTGQWRISYYNGTSYYGTGIVNVNQWSHIAFVRSGSTMTFYVNGIAGGTATISGTQAGTATTNPVWIGTKDNSIATYGTVGYISNFRIVNGTAVYTANFTPATTPLTAITNTQLLTCQDARFVDNSTNAYTLTAGSATTTPRQQNPFGWTTSATQDYSTATFGGSGYFDGTGDYLEVPHSTNQWIGLNQDFTIECWFNATGGSGERALISKGYQGSPVYAEFGIVINSSNQLLGLTSASGGSWLATPTDTVAISNNTWNHVALVRSGTTITLYRNGVAAATSTGVGAALYNHTAPIRIGQHSSGSNFTGYISNARIVIGTALYTSNFVPPSQPLTAVTNTTLLLNMDKSAISDKSGKVVLETVADTKLSTAVKKYGSSSMYFDGNSDHVLSRSIVPLGAGDFTFEMWIYPLDAATRHVMSFPAGWSPADGISIIQYGGNYATSCGSVGNANAGQAVEINGWHHIAMVRNNTSVKFYYDGVLKNTATDSTNLTGTAISLGYIVPGASSSWGSFYGYMDDVRITRGYARYTTNFTPPTTLLTK